MHFGPDGRHVPRQKVQPSPICVLLNRPLYVGLSIGARRKRWRYSDSDRYPMTCYFTFHITYLLTYLPCWARRFAVCLRVGRQSCCILVERVSSLMTGRLQTRSVQTHWPPPAAACSSDTQTHRVRLSSWVVLLSDKNVTCRCLHVTWAYVITAFSLNNRLHCNWQPRKRAHKNYSSITPVSP